MRGKPLKVRGARLRTKREWNGIRRRRGRTRREGGRWKGWSDAWGGLRVMAVNERGARRRPLGKRLI